MKIMMKVGPRNEANIEMARKAMKVVNAPLSLRQWLSLFMNASEMADAMFYLIGESQEYLSEIVDVNDAIVDELYHAYINRERFD